MVKLVACYEKSTDPNEKFGMEPWSPRLIDEGRLVNI